MNATETTLTTTAHVYDLDRARVAKAGEVIDALDKHGWDASMRAASLASLGGKDIWITIKNKPGRKGYEIGKVKINAEGELTCHGADRKAIAQVLGI